MFDDELRNFAIWIVKIAKHPDSCHTGRHAGRFLPFLDKFDTKPTFFDVALSLDNPDIVGAGSNTIFTTDALILIHQNHSIFSLMGGPCRTDLHARRIIAMLTLDRYEFTSVVWKSAIFTLFQVIISLLLIEIVLIMASYSTGMTPDTLRFINHHSISRHNSNPLRLWRIAH